MTDERTVLFRAILVSREYAFHRITGTVSCITTSTADGSSGTGESDQLEGRPSSKHGIVNCQDSIEDSQSLPDRQKKGRRRRKYPTIHLNGAGREILAFPRQRDDGVIGLGGRSSVCFSRYSPSADLQSTGR